MILKKYFKQIAILGLAFVVFTANSNIVKAKKTVNTTYTYYSNEKIKTKKNVITDGKKKLRVELYTYNSKGVLKTLNATNYGKNNKKLKVAKYKYSKKKRLNVKNVYYYNVHSKAKTKKPLKKKYMTAYYNKKGKLRKKVFHTKDAKRNEIVRMAKKQVGKRYRYGGNSPSGFDCSGLTSYVYKKSVNKNIGRTSVSQSKKGKYVKVSTKKLKKGDILFWGSKSSPYHVGVYVGNGKYVHAGTTSTGVQYKKLSSYTPSYAKRLIK